MEIILWCGRTWFRLQPFKVASSPSAILIIQNKLNLQEIFEVVLSAMLIKRLLSGCIYIIDFFLISDPLNRAHLD